MLPVRPFLLCLLVFAMFAGTVSAQPPPSSSIDLIPLPALRGFPASPALGDMLAVAPTAEGDLLLLEAANLRVLRVDDRGRYVGEAGGFGFGDGSLRGATDLATAGFESWIADPLAGRIVRFDSWLAPLPPGTAALDGNTERPFIQPRSVARLPSGDAVVLDADRPELLLIDPDGRLVERVGRFGELERGFGDPRRVEIGADGGIAVADPGRRAVLRFDRFGSPRGLWPWTGESDGPLGLVADGDGWWVVGADELHRLGSRGQVRQRWTAGALGMSPGSLRDVTVWRGELVLAAGAAAHRFRVDRDGEE